MLRVDELKAAVEAAFPDPYTAPRPLNLLHAALAVREGDISVAEGAEAARTTTRRLLGLVASEDLIRDLVGLVPGFTPDSDEKTRSTLGQLLIGKMAEVVFLSMWQEEMNGQDLHIVDDTATRGDTDFLIRDTVDRPVFRLNIKFHGSSFRRAEELVGLHPDDTFALATYKIHSALLRQDAEHVSYLFVVVGVRGLTGAVVGEILPDNLVRLTALAHASKHVTGKRRIEEAVIDQLIGRPQDFGVRSQIESYLARLRGAEWRVISARRADQLLKSLLFQRAYALRVRGFARNYGGAELDMHFSVSADLHPLADLFSTLREHGMMGLASRLERGTL